MLATPTEFRLTLAPEVLNIAFAFWRNLTWNFVDSYMLFRAADITVMPQETSSMVTFNAVAADLDEKASISEDGRFMTPSQRLAVNARMPKQQKGSPAEAGYPAVHRHALGLE